MEHRGIMEKLAGSSWLGESEALNATVKSKVGGDGADESMMAMAITLPTTLTSVPHKVRRRFQGGPSRVDRVWTL